MSVAWIIRYNRQRPFLEERVSNISQLITE